MCKKYIIKVSEKIHIQYPEGDIFWGTSTRHRQKAPKRKQPLLIRLLAEWTYIPDRSIRLSLLVQRINALFFKSFKMVFHYLNLFRGVSLPGSNFAYHSEWMA